MAAAAAETVEETIKRICTHKGVEGVLISNYEGVALKSTLSAALTTKYAGLMAQLVVKARSVIRTIDAEVRAGGGGGGAARCAAARVGACGARAI